MRRYSKGLITVTLGIAAVVCPLLYAAPVWAANPTLQNVTNKPVTKQEPQRNKTMRERVEEILAEKPKAQVAGIPKGEAYVPGGTEFAVELVDELSAKKNRKGDFVRLRMCDNIIINDVIVIPAGARVEGHIVKAYGPGLLGRAGMLEFAVDSVQTINEITVPLEYAGRIQAMHDPGALLVGAMYLPGGILIRGSNVRVPAGTKIIAKVKADTDLMTKLDNLAEAMDTSKPRGVKITLK